MRGSLMALTTGAMLLAGCSQPASQSQTESATEAPPAEATPAAPSADAAPPATTSAAEATAGSAAIRMLDATCPGDIRLHADAGGPVTINGHGATIGAANPNYYEASDAGSGVTVSVTTNPDGSQQVSYSGKGRTHGACTVDAAAPAQGRIVLLNATCPGDVSVHAADGGPVFINGTQAALSISNPTYYEAKDAGTGVVVSVSTDPDGRQSVSYSGKGGANGVCQVDG